MGFHWSLNDIKSLQVSRILFSILVNLNNGRVWMVLILPLISNYSNLLFNPLGIVPSTPTTIGITITAWSTFFSFSCKIQVLAISFWPLSGPLEWQNPHILSCFFFFFFFFFFEALVLVLWYPYYIIPLFQISFIFCIIYMHSHSFDLCI